MTRQPWRALDIARQLDCCPDPARTVIVTGSKGKGTVARLVAATLRQAGHHVGLVVTPEEIEHRDRIRIDNQPIPEEAFSKCFERIEPLMREALSRAPANYYFPPTALFLLVALVWFSEQGVDYLVLEGGRGARYDEIGQIDAALGIISSIYLEHAVYLGRTVQEIAADKSAVVESCRQAVVAEQARSLLEALPGWSSVAHKVSFTDLEEGRGEMRYPAWYARNRAVAKLAVERLLGEDMVSLAEVPTASFGRIETPRGCIWYDGAIVPDCLDGRFISNLRPRNSCALLGLNDDKDVDGIVGRLRAMGFADIRFVLLTTSLDYFSNDDVMRKYGEQVLVRIDMDDAGGALKAVCDSLLESYEGLYVVGVQLTLRMLRRAYGLELAG